MEMLKVTSYEVLGKLPELMKLENGKKVENADEQEYNGGKEAKFSMKEPVFKKVSETAEKDASYFEEWDARSRAASEKYGLTDVEDRAIRKYVGGDAFEWTSIQRGEDDFERTEYIEWWIDNATSALEKMPEYKGRTYRNLVFKTAEAYQAFLRENAKGEDVPLPAFTSTSKDPNGYTVDGDYVAHMVIDGTSGKDISNTFGIPEQQEVVFMPGSVLHVDSVGVANDALYSYVLIKTGKSTKVNPLNT